MASSPPSAVPHHKTSNKKVPGAYCSALDTGYLMGKPEQGAIYAGDAKTANAIALDKIPGQ
jgi:hypothetical protein